MVLFVCFLFIVLVYSELLFLSVGLLFIFHIRGILQLPVTFNYLLIFKSGETKKSIWKFEPMCETCRLWDNCTGCFVYL